MPRKISIGTLVLVTTLAVVPLNDAFAQRGGGRGGGGGGRAGGGGPSPGNRGAAPQPAANRGPAMVGPQAKGPATPSRPGGNAGPGAGAVGGGATRPAPPAAGPQRPAQPGIGQPGIGQPGAGQTGGLRPATPGATNPNRPGLGGTPQAGAAKPGNGIGRQPSGSMNDFFGGNAGVSGAGNNRPGQANTQGGGRLPGMGQGQDNRPGLGNDNSRTNVGDRRTNVGDRNTNVGDRNTNIGDRNTKVGDRTNNNVNVGDRTNKGGNTVINTGDINVGNKTNYNDNRQQWVDNRHNNGNVVRNNAGGRYWNGYNNPGWHAPGGYAYWGGWGAPGYGWQAASWATMGAFVGAALVSQPQPVYYAYGTGGNVYYENNTVYVNGQAAGTPAEYTQQAQALVQAAPPVDQPQEWMPLGVFALSREGTTDTQAVIELAVSKTGAIAGTYHNEASGVSRPVKGTANLETQRAAIGFADGKNADLALETGLYNLTQDEAPGLLHTGAEQTEPVLLVRLQKPAAPQ